MSKHGKKNEDETIIHVAPCKEKANEKYIEAKGKRFDETNKRLREALGDNKRRKI
jgi:replicative superfamily II helicase